MLYKFGHHPSSLCPWQSKSTTEFISLKHIQHYLQSCLNFSFTMFPKMNLKSHGEVFFVVFFFPILLITGHIFNLFWNVHQRLMKHIKSARDLFEMFHAKIDADLSLIVKITELFHYNITKPHVIIEHK